MLSILPALDFFWCRFGLPLCTSVVTVSGFGIVNLSWVVLCVLESPHPRCSAASSPTLSPCWLSILL